MDGRLHRKADEQVVSSAIVQASRTLSPLRSKPKRVGEMVNPGKIPT